MAEQTYSVVEIFNSIDGEGPHAGFLSTFVRFQGCNCECTYCDTRYSWAVHEARVWTKEFLLKEIARYAKGIGCKHLTITGGEPLIQPGIYDLLLELLVRGYVIDVETNGTISIEPFSRLRNFGQIQFILDYKCPSAEALVDFCEANFWNMMDGDVLKFVVSNKDDLLEMADVISGVKKQWNRPMYYVSPCAPKMTPDRIVNFLMEHHLTDVRLQLQLHKIIWPAAKRGV